MICDFVLRELKLNNLTCCPLSCVELFLTWVPFETSSVSRRMPFCVVDLPDHLLLFSARVT